MHTPTTEEIRRLYEDSHQSLLRDSDRQNHRSIRHGYFDEDTESEASAADNMRRTLSSLVSLEETGTVLDVGCGFGDDATWLASHDGVEVLGINIVEEQLEVARSLARERGVGDQVSFRIDDFHEMASVPDDSIDVVWCVEALCHARDDALVVEQIDRVLDDGGQAVVADLFLTDRSRASESSVETYREELGTNPEPLETAVEAFDKCGYAVRTRDVTGAIVPSAKRNYRYGLWGHPYYRLRGVLTRSQTDRRYASTARGMKSQYRAIRDGSLLYAIVVATSASSR
ncbi:SAM-dependent methyltransferase [Natronobiforma cellulositropha]|uniref:SAM-dependent methyltransferase n=1 Tax=Natronobiforma cellulositropha TaxID=1679076 RepID=UPI0021D59E5D|nr:class I SAM-dependent methyltransferase [Natronobiforma cellulositropha]